MKINQLQLPIKAEKTLRVLLIFILVSIASFTSAQTTYYWVGGATGNINAGANWSTTSGGIAGTGTITLSSTTTLIFDANSVASVTVTNNGGNPASLAKLHIKGGRNVSIIPPTNSTGITINGVASDALLIEANSSLTIQGGVLNTQTLTLANTTGITADISGKLTLANDNSFFHRNANATVIFRNGSEYFHNRSVGTGTGVIIPTATWQDGSTCRVTRPHAQFQPSFKQNFFNLILEQTGTATGQFNMSSTTKPDAIRGTFTINSTGSGYIVIGPSLTLDVGNLVINDGTFVLNASSSTSGTVLNVGGNCTINGGQFIGSTNSSRVSIVNIEGSLIRNSGDFWAYNVTTTSGAGYTEINFTNTSGANNSSVLKLQNSLNRYQCKWDINIASGRKITLESDIEIGTGNTSGKAFQLFNVANGATLDLGTYIIKNGSGAFSPGYDPRFTLNSGATLITAHPDGITTTATGTAGSVQVTGTRTYNAAANYEYNGSVVQNTGNGLTAANHLTINNTHSGGVTLSNNCSVSGQLRLYDGKFNTGACNSTTTSSTLLTLTSTASSVGASNNSFVNGVMRKTGNTAFTFPVGWGNTVGDTAIYAPAGIAAPSVVTDQFGACYLYKNPRVQIGNVLAPTLHHISLCEYWHLNRTSGTSNVAVDLSWDARSCGVDNLSELRVARWNGSLWANEGNTGTTGSTSAGTITSNSISTFSPFTLSSITVNNPLPVKFAYFEALKVERTAHLNWGTATENNNHNFQVLRSKDLNTWESIATVLGAGNSSIPIDYSVIDSDPYYGVNYYKIKQVDFNGDFEYSMIKSVSFLDDLLVVPNPSTGHFMLVGLEKDKLNQIQLYNALGKTIYEVETKSETFTFNDDTLSAGVYFITINKDTQIKFTILK